MVTNSRQLDMIFGALADPTRRDILTRLAKEESTVGDLAHPYAMSRPAISKHLRVLERAGLVLRTKDGRISRCGLDASPLRDAADWVGRYQEFWEQQFNQLTRFLEESEDES